MKYIFSSLLILVFFFQNSFAQDTLFYDKLEYKIISNNEAIYYSLLPTENIDSVNYTITMFLMNGQKFKDKTFNYKKNERVVKYYEDGNVNWVIDYGEHNFKKIVSYWPNRQLKREDIYVEGEFQKGQCFDSLGNKIKHIDFSIQPQFPGGEDGFKRFFVKNFNSKGLKKSQEQALIWFVVSIDGNMEGIKILRATSVEMVNESNRIIDLMPKWIPGSIDGETVEMEFTLPLAFRDEY